MDYNKLFLEEYRSIRKIEKKPKLLLHVCCGACSIYPLIYLTYLFDVTILYTNSNIYPKEEFDKRLNAVKNYVSFINETFDENISLIEDLYDYDNFRLGLVPFKDEKEGGNRCKICIAKRMKRLFQYAEDLNFKYVSTIMSISRNKDVEYLSRSGERLEKEYSDIKFIHFDFKKNNGQDLGVAIGREATIYRQDYCGCEFSQHDF